MFVIFLFPVGLRVEAALWTVLNATDFWQSLQVRVIPVHKCMHHHHPPPPIPPKHTPPPKKKKKKKIHISPSIIYQYMFIFKS